MRKPILCAAIAAAVLAGLAGCATLGLGHGPIESFVIPAAANPGLQGDIVGALDSIGTPRGIGLVVPVGTNLRSLVARFSLNAEATIAVVSSGSRVVQENGATANDFSAPVTYSIEIAGEKRPWLYRVTAREVDTNPRLARIILPEDSRLQPGMDPLVREYRAEVPFASTTVRIEARAQSPYARSVAVEGISTSGSLGHADVDFSSLQEKPVTIDILAEDGATREVYTITLVRGAPDRDARLESLEIRGYAFSDSFMPDRASYRLMVPYETRSLVLLAKSESRFAKVALAAGTAARDAQSVAVPYVADGDPKTPAGASIDFSQPESLPLVVSVTAQDGSLRQYFVEIMRGPPDSNNLLADLTLSVGGISSPLSPGFAPSQPRFEAELPYAAAQVKLSAHAQSRFATLQLGDGRAGGSIRGDPGSKDGALVDLPPGVDRFSLLLMVTAQSGVARGYIVELRRTHPDRNAELRSLKASVGALSPLFSPRVLDYSLELSANSESVSIEARTAGPGATVTIAGKAGIAPAPALTYVVDLAPGASSTVGLLVRAEDGSQRQYLVKVSRAPASPPVQDPLPLAPSPQPSP
jgi:hypothetical protein